MLIPSGPREGCEGDYLIHGPSHITPGAESPAELISPRSTPRSLHTSPSSPVLGASNSSTSPPTMFSTAASESSDSNESSIPTGPILSHHLLEALLPSCPPGISRLLGPFRSSSLPHSPPYEVNDEPDPLQSYGRQKRDGEIAVLAEQEKGAKATVLRVPILYGRVEYNAESAVNLLQDGEYRLGLTASSQSPLTRPSLLHPPPFPLSVPLASTEPSEGIRW
jgi:hypothetical protein